MELREYWRIVYRRVWLIMALVLVVLAVNLVVPSSPRPVQFQATSRFTVGLRPEPATGEVYTYDHYYTWLASEYLVDDLAEVVGGTAFSRAVEGAVQTQGAPPSRPLGGAFSASTKHRTLTLQIMWNDAQELSRIAAAAQQVLVEHSGGFFGQVGESEVVVEIIDPPAIMPLGPGLREQVDLPLRLLLALAVGIALAFVLHYLDDAVYDRAEVENLGIAVLSELPPHPRRRRFFWQRPLP
jgi:capsular polysaccharide biosynthesis protein